MGFLWCSNFYLFIDGVCEYVGTIHCFLKISMLIVIKLYVFQWVVDLNVFNDLNGFNLTKLVAMDCLNIPVNVTVHVKSNN